MKYRSEIDGLRALAVVPVILFHAGFEFFSGGFVGVDVFFVISGYLITTILINELEDSRFSIVNFYERRARRILPALFFVMLVCIPVAWILLLPSQMKVFSQSLIAVSLFSSNLLFWRKSDYFDPAAEENPLLHTWSLAVEEQYYLVFPILLMFTWSLGKRYVFWIIVFIAAISFGLSEWGWRNQPSANFYLIHTRAWELLAGSLAAFIVYKQGVKSNNWLSSIGFLAIVFSIFFYDETTPFPSFYTALPVLGVVLLVLYSSQEVFVAKLLSAKACVGIGLISFSAYLWHQPLFAFARIAINDSPSQVFMLGLTIVSFLLAFLSWKYIEQPFRSKDKFSRQYIFSVSLAVGVIFVLAGLIGHTQNGFDYRLTKQQEEIIAYEQYPRQEFYREGICFLTPEQSHSTFSEECVNDTDGSIIWGDSHAAALASGWYKLDKNLSQLTASQCPPFISSVNKKNPHCEGVVSFALNELKKNPSKHVYLHAYWENYNADDLNKIGETIVYLQELGVKQISIIGGVPIYANTLPSSLVKEGATLTSSHKSRPISGGKEARKIDSQLSTIAAARGVGFVSVLDKICENEKCISVIENNGEYFPTQWDMGHLTFEGSLFINRKLKLYQLGGVTLFNGGLTVSER